MLDPEIKAYLPWYLQFSYDFCVLITIIGIFVSTFFGGLTSTAILLLSVLVFLFGIGMTELRNKAIGRAYRLHIAKLAQETSQES